MSPFAFRINSKLAHKVLNDLTPLFLAILILCHSLCRAHVLVILAIFWFQEDTWLFSMARTFSLSMLLFPGYLHAWFLII